MNPSPLAQFPVFAPSYVSAHPRAQFLKVLLIIGAVFSVLSMLLGGLWFAFPPITGDEEFGDNPGGMTVGLLSLGVAVPAFLLRLVTIVLFLMWVHRSHKNLPAFGTPRQSLSYSPGWAVGGFFIPFGNLFIPYRVVKEIWQNSAPASQTFMSLSDPPTWFPLWWGFWIVSNIVTRVYDRLSSRESIAEESAMVIAIIADALTTVAAILAFVIVSEIDERQEETSKLLSLGKYAVPPAPPVSLSATDGRTDIVQAPSETPPTSIEGGSQEE